MDDASPPPLEYAPKEKAMLRFRHVLLAAVTLAIISAPWWLTMTWRRAVLLYWQHQCMNYAASPSTVIWEPDAPGASSLLMHPEYVSVALAGHSPAAAHETNQWMKFSQALRVTG